MESTKKYILLSFSFIGYYLIAHVFFRSEFLLELSAFGLCFIAYLYFGKSIKWQLRNLFLAGLFFRLIFIWGEPRLSDDYYRFIWDAKLIADGQNPYEKIPSNHFGDLLYPNNDERGLDLLMRMNSPDYFSVYPPLQQLFFIPAAFGDTVLEAVLILRLIILLGELLLFYFLMKSIQKKIMDERLIPWLWLNPLWIIEVNGNLHFEGWMITFMFIGIYYLRNQLNYLGALFLGLAAGLKMIPIILVPLLKKWMGFRSSLVLVIFISFVFMSTLAFLFYGNNLTHFSRSIDLYYHKFEFNASFYILLGWIGSFFTDTHRIIYSSSILMGFFVMVYFYRYLKADKNTFNDFIRSAALLLSSYYLLSTTFHPWYVLPILYLSVMSGFSYGIIWSGLVFLSYSFYQENETMANVFWIMEYALIFIFMYLEFRKKITFLPKCVKV